MTDAELEALAMYMGHSVSEQRATYDRRTSAQRVEPAVELISGLLAGDASRKPANAAAARDGANCSTPKVVKSSNS